MKKIALIGSTGSIGRQVISVVNRHPEKFKIVSIAGGFNSALLREQAKALSPLVVCSADDNFCNDAFCSDAFRIADFRKDICGKDNFIKDNSCENNLCKDKLCVKASGEFAENHAKWRGAEVFTGENAFTNAIIEEADVVVVALVGFKGIIAVLDAIKKGKDVALANKESLVVGGDLVMAAAKEKGVKIIPIDSEHSAIWQSLGFDFHRPFKKIILTCSGGAFRDYDKEKLKTATVKDALRHPNWNMGAKITVDCATLVNKGFEVIEAHHLYNASFDDIEVIIHKESVIHSMVEYIDGAIIAEMSYPSMEIPISLALSYPERLTVDVPAVDFKSIKNLTFSAPDYDRFPCLKLVTEAGRTGGLYPAVINGANDGAVKLFLEGKIGYTDIYKSLDGALNAFGGNKSRLTYEDYESANAFGGNYVKNLFGE